MAATGPTLFASDLHLSPDRPGALHAFHRFASGPARNAAAVYFLGDLFDWWIGDDQMRDPFVRTIVKSLAGIAAAGVPLQVGHGNRDFALGGRFAAAAGCRLLDDVELLDLHGVPTLISHGDEMCTDDHQYQEYRARMRDPTTQARLLRLPYSFRRAFAWWLQRRSRNDKALKPESIMDVSERAVIGAFRAHGARRMIHGHTHRPARHEHVVDGTVCERYVLADWRDTGHVLAVDAAGVTTRTIAP